MPASQISLILASITCWHRERRLGRWNLRSRRQNGHRRITWRQLIRREPWPISCRKRTRQWSNHGIQVITWSKNQLINCRTRVHLGRSCVAIKPHPRSHWVSCPRLYLIWGHSATTQLSSRCPVPTLWAVRETPVAPLLDYHRWCSMHQRKMLMSPSRRRSRQRTMQRW